MRSGGNFFPLVFFLGTPREERVRAPQSEKGELRRKVIQLFNIKYSK